MPLPRPLLGLLLLTVLLGACDRPQPPERYRAPQGLDTSGAARHGAGAQAPGAAVLDRSAVAQRAALVAGEVSSVALIEAALARIEARDGGPLGTGAVLELNPDARAEAASRDAELARRGAAGVGALHGVPVLLKGNIDTGDALHTSAGSLLLVDHLAPDDAHLVRGLRAAGAVILGKSNLSEWANFRGARSVSGWSSVGGQTRNPHVLDRTPCGSSSGSAVAVAAGFVPVAVGTETNGSIVCPAGVNGIVGIKPTRGLVSRDGIIPIAEAQDTAGPMARTVRDAAVLLEAMAAPDPEDPAAVAVARVPRRFLPPPGDPDLSGVRIGVIRDFRGSGELAPVERTYAAALDRLARLGAELVDPIEIRIHDGVSPAQGRVLLAEFRDGIERYLRASGVPEDRDTLAELVALNAAAAARIMPHFGQERFEQALEAAEVGSDAHRRDLAASGGALRTRLAEVLQGHRLDVLVVPTNGPAWKIDWILGDQGSGVSTSTLAAVSGHPSVTVPAGFDGPLPLGLSFVGAFGEDARVIRIADAFERAGPGFRRPAFLRTVDTGE